MKRTSLISVLAMIVAAPAVAGTLADPYIEPLPMPAPMVVAGFDGFYVGVMGGIAMGDVTLFPAIPGPTTALDGMTYGGFAGYNFQSGNIVYGVEVDAQFGTMTVGAIDLDIDYLIDARARLGYAFSDSAMVYVAGGYSTGQASLAVAPFTSGTADGWNLGAGVEINVTDNIFIGGEYVYRDLSGTFGPAPGVPIDVNLNTIQVKVGMRF